MDKKAAKEILAGYVNIAQKALEIEYGANYTDEDLSKLAMVLVAQDQQAAMEKEAEFAIFSSFAEELKNQGVNPIPVLKKLNEILEN
jgi:hypothetical protein